MMMKIIGNLSRQWQIKRCLSGKKTKTRMVCTEKHRVECTSMTSRELVLATAPTQEDARKSPPCSSMVCIPFFSFWGVFSSFPLPSGRCLSRGEEPLTAPGFWCAAHPLMQHVMSAWSDVCLMTPFVSLNENYSTEESGTWINLRKVQTERKHTHVVHILLWFWCRLESLILR